MQHRNYYNIIQEAQTVIMQDRSFVILRSSRLCQPVIHIKVLVH